VPSSFTRFIAVGDSWMTRAVHVQGNFTDSGKQVVIWSSACWKYDDDIYMARDVVTNVIEKKIQFWSLT
jgi:hypothetical protein